jgi:hypothetical protein
MEGYLKTIKIIKNATLMMMILILIISCTATGLLKPKQKPRVAMFTDSYASKELDAHIDVYQTTKPGRKYIEIAKISCNDSSDSWNMKQILIKAREIGADGIIIVRRVSSAGGVVPVEKVPAEADEAYGIVAIAIVYK